MLLYVTKMSASHAASTNRNGSQYRNCDSVVPLKRDSNHLSSLPGIPLPLHAGLLSCVPAGTLPRCQYEIVCRIRTLFQDASAPLFPCIQPHDSSFLRVRRGVSSILNPRWP